MNPIKGEFLFNRNAYIARHEPMILHCHHYNTFLQASLEDTKSYLPVYPILIDSARDIAYLQLNNHFKANNILTILERLQIASDFFSYCGFGKADFSKLTTTGGNIPCVAEHYSTGWMDKFGARKNNEPGVSFFATGYFAGAFEAIFDKKQGQFKAVQTHCITKGDTFSAFEIVLNENVTEHYKSPQEGFFQLFTPYDCQKDAIDSDAIKSALVQMPIMGNEKNGLIEAFGVLLTRMYANYYCLISYRTLQILKDTMGADGVVLGTQLLTEAGHVCAFNTFGGIMKSVEWMGLIKPMITSKEDWVYGIVAVVNAFGWGQWEVVELIANKKLVIKIKSGYESNSYLKMFEKSLLPISFLATGGVAGIMNLIYNGDISKNPELNEVYYKKIQKSQNYFIAKQTKCRATGDEFDEFEAFLKYE